MLFFLASTKSIVGRLITYASLFQLDHLGTLIAFGLEGRLGNLPVFEFADKGVWVLFLVEVAQGVVDSSVAGLVGSNVQNQVFHGSVALRHVPVLDGHLLVDLFSLTPVSLLFSLLTCTAISGIRNLGSFHLGKWPSSISAIARVYVCTASSSR